MTNATITPLVIQSSKDAGGYYCAHTLFALHQRTPPTVLRTPAGDPHVGFLHTPPDAWTEGSTPPKGGASRHALIASAVAMAFVGLRAMAPASALGDEKWRVLLTGFGEFRDVTSNPTGAFVGAWAPLQKTVEHVFGPAVRTDEPLPCLQTEGEEVFPAVLSVDDSALDRTAPKSLFSLMRRVRPHAVLSLGVCRLPHFCVEVAPTDRGLIHKGVSEWTHVDGREATVELRHNRTLLEAMEDGAQRLRRSDKVAFATSL